MANFVGVLQQRAGALLACLVVCCAGCSTPPAETTHAVDKKAATHVGRRACVACHAEENRAWQDSHHDLAMQEANGSTVLGDFDDAAFTYYGTTSTFFRRGSNYFVRTDGPDGKLTEYEVAYTFGVEPLQQYLIGFPDGRYQALNICWDTRPVEEGGQRWFHLYPDEEIDHRDPLHWTGVYQNWNFMCAECHSTRLRKGYDAEQDRYETTWFEIDVSCEACHGPGSRHVVWAEKIERGESPDPDPRRGLVVRLADTDDAAWVMDKTTGIAKRSVPRRSNVEVELCARCHSRRSLISEDYVHGSPLTETHRPSLLSGDLYHADGQIRDEVYVYGSFVQSKMYRAGVTCRDCHDPHSLRLHGPADIVCARCHLPARFDTTEHHLHEKGSAGARCIACHMPKTSYMVVDPRGDHSFRVPRPDLTIKLGTPNSCNGCHTDKSPEWAAERLDGRLDATASPHYAEALHAGQRGLPGARQQLEQLARDSEQPGIARATALLLLQGVARPETVPVIRQALEDKDPLVRLGALMALDAYAPADRPGLALLLLDDPVRSVRIEAARLLASARQQSLSATQRSRLDRALEEYRQVQLLNGDRAEAHLNLGLLHMDLGQPAGAEAEYRKAIARERSFLPARANLADLYRMQGREEDGERVLREALEVGPDNPEIQHALGLLLVRRQRLDEGLRFLNGAALARPQEPRYAYVQGVALHSSGRTADALVVLHAAHERHPGDPDLLVALATISRDAGSLDAAVDYAAKLVDLAPGNPQARLLLEELEAGRQP
jgi:Flp pilus assembly protein TadD